VIGSDAPVLRETVETAAVVTRIAPSFLRFGFFRILFFGSDVTGSCASWRLRDRDCFPQLREAAQPYLELADPDQPSHRSIDGALAGVGFCHG